MQNSPIPIFVAAYPAAPITAEMKNTVLCRLFRLNPAKIAAMAIPLMKACAAAIAISNLFLPEYFRQISR